MYSKPLVMDRFYTVHTSFIVDFTFLNNITMLMGDSGTGKSAVFSFMRECALEDSRLICLNYLDINRDYETLLKTESGKLFIIDNADVLLTDEERKMIAFDTKNQYLIVGRNPGNMLATEDNFYELGSEMIGQKTRFFLKAFFE